MVNYNISVQKMMQLLDTLKISGEEIGFQQTVGDGAYFHYKNGQITLYQDTLTPFANGAKAGYQAVSISADFANVLFSQTSIPYFAKTTYTSGAVLPRDYSSEGGTPQPNFATNFLIQTFWVSNRWSSTLASSYIKSYLRGSNPQPLPQIPYSRKIDIQYTHLNDFSESKWQY